MPVSEVFRSFLCCIQKKEKKKKKKHMEKEHKKDFRVEIFEAGKMDLKTFLEKGGRFKQSHEVEDEDEHCCMYHRHINKALPDKISIPEEKLDYKPQKYSAQVRILGRFKVISLSDDVLQQEEQHIKRNSKVRHHHRKEGRKVRTAPKEDPTEVRILGRFKVKRLSDDVLQQEEQHLKTKSKARHHHRKEEKKVHTSTKEDPTKVRIHGRFKVTRLSDDVLKQEEKQLKTNSKARHHHRKEEKKVQTSPKEDPTKDSEGNVEGVNAPHVKEGRESGLCDGPHNKEIHTTLENVMKCPEETLIENTSPDSERNAKGVNAPQIKKTRESGLCDGPHNKEIYTKIEILLKYPEGTLIAETSVVGGGDVGNAGEKSEEVTAKNLFRNSLGEAVGI